MFLVLLLAISPCHADVAEASHPLDYDPNVLLQDFYYALPDDLRQKIGQYRVKASELEQEVAEYNERPTTGIPPASFRTAQRARMKIEAKTASLRLEQKAIAKEYYDLLATGWEPPNNSNILRLLVASNSERPTT